MSRDENKMYKAIISMVIEKALLDMGQAAYDQVVHSLREEYHCHLTDCYEHPEYLHKVLKEFYGNASNVVIKSIKEDLEDWKTHKQIKRFLQVICR